VKRTYEFTREIFNNCSGNQMRDVFIEDIDADDSDIDAIIGKHLVGDEIECDRHTSPDGSVVADIITDGMRQRLTFERC
jgi:hypothetical protein